MSKRDNWDLLGKQNAFAVSRKPNPTEKYSDIVEAYNHWRKENGTSLWIRL